MALKLEKYSTFILVLILFQSAYQLMSETIPSIAMSEMHERWMIRYGQIYKSKEEKEARAKIFADNVEFIKNFNQAQNHTYKLGINKFSDLTKEEFLAAYIGNAKPPPRSLFKSSFKYENVSLEQIPPCLDWRMMGTVTDVKNQAGCGSCWAFATVAAVEGINQIKTGQLIALSVQQIMDCDEYPDGCNGNNAINAMDYVISSGGLASESDYPYKAKEEVCHIPPGYPLMARITSHETTPFGDEGALLRAVANQPVVVAIDASLFHSYKSGILSGQCGTDLIHAITIVGYGVSEDGMKYWILKNSYGKDWGENGYVRIQRESGTAEGMCGIAMSSSYPIM